MSETEDGGPVDRDVRRELAEALELIRDLDNERAALWALCAAAYQVVGAAEGPEQMMDNLAAAGNGRPLPHDPTAGLPWSPGETPWDALTPNA